MRITLEVPEHRAAFMLELLCSLPFVTLRGRAAKAAALDETGVLVTTGRKITVSPKVLSVNAL